MLQLKVRTFDIAPRTGKPTLEALRYGTRCQEISQFYLHTYTRSIPKRNEPPLCLPDCSWSSFYRPRTKTSKSGQTFLCEMSTDSLIHIVTSHNWLLSNGDAMHARVLIITTAIRVVRCTCLSYYSTVSTTQVYMHVMQCKLIGTF